MNAQDINTSTSTAAQQAGATADTSHNSAIDSAASVAQAAAGAAAYATTQQVLKDVLPTFDLGKFQAEDFTSAVNGNRPDDLIIMLNRHSQVVAAHNARLADLEADRKENAFKLSDYVTMENAVIAAGVVVGGTALVIGTVAVVGMVTSMFNDVDVPATA